MNADHLEEVMLQQVGPIIACPFPPPSAPLDRLSNLPARFSVGPCPSTGGCPQRGPGAAPLGARAGTGQAQGHRLLTARHGEAYGGLRGACCSETKVAGGWGPCGGEQLRRGPGSGGGGAATGVSGLAAGMAEGAPARAGLLAAHRGGSRA